MNDIPIKTTNGTFDKTVTPNRTDLLEDLLIRLKPQRLKSADELTLTQGRAFNKQIHSEYFNAILIIFFIALVVLMKIV